MHDFSRPIDLIDECVYKIAFLEDCFTQPIALNSTHYLSNDGCQGLSLILREIKSILSKSTDVIAEQNQKRREEH